MTPLQFHYGHAQEALEKHNQVLVAAYAVYLTRFVLKTPRAGE